jgi:hypothetical protein
MDAAALCAVRSTCQQLSSHTIIASHLRELAHALFALVSVIGTLGAIVLAFIIKAIGDRYIDHHYRDRKEHYSKRTLLTTVVILTAAIVIIIF